MLCARKVQLAHNEIILSGTQDRCYKSKNLTTCYERLVHGTRNSTNNLAQYRPPWHCHSGKCFVVIDGKSCLTSGLCQQMIRLHHRIATFRHDVCTRSEKKPKESHL